MTSAVQLFNEIGYSATGLGDIIERAELTKGALYYHFDSKAALATAIIEEGSASMFEAFYRISDSPAPAMERIIHGLFVVADRLSTDEFARSGVHLLRAFGEFNDAAARTYTLWVDEMVQRVREAVMEGDLRADLDADAVGETIVSAILGAELLSSATASGTDVLNRLTRLWQVLLPAVVAEESLGYFREYLGREAMRRSVQTAG